VFRALTDVDGGLEEGLFLREGGAVRPVAVTGQDLGQGMALNTLQGRGLLDDAGNVFFKARVDLAAGEIGGVVMQSSSAGLQPLLRTEERLPNGGLVRSLGRPSVSSDGTVASRLGFWPFSGGAPGLFLARAGVPPENYLRNGEGGAAGIEGRLTNLNQNVSHNRNGRVAFLGSVGGGSARHAIFLAAPSEVRVERLAFRLGPGPLSPKADTPRDRVKFTVRLTPGDLPEPQPTTERKPADLVRARPKLVAVAVADQVGPLWSGVVQAEGTRLRGRTLKKKKGPDGDGQGVPSGVDVLRTQFGNESIRITVRSKRFRLSDRAASSTERRYDPETLAPILEPPFIVRVDVGEDGGAGSVECPPPGSRRRFGCGR
jgi:hypothetical protein